MQQGTFYDTLKENVVEKGSEAVDKGFGAVFDNDEASLNEGVELGRTPSGRNRQGLLFPEVRAGGHRCGETLSGEKNGEGGFREDRKICWRRFGRCTGGAGSRWRPKDAGF